MSDKKFYGIIAVIVIALIGAVFIFGNNSGTNGDFIGDPLKVQTGVAENEGEEVQRADHTLGAGNKGVTIIEYGDFECSACRGFYPELKQIEQEYGDDIQVVYRHNPLSELHPNAVAAHRAAVAASNQGRFWEMHDQLYETQPSWSRVDSGLSLSDAASVFEGYAEQLGLDMDQYRSDVSSEETFAYIDSHLDSGNQLGVTGTPTVFINGEEVPSRTFEDMKSIIDDIINDQSSSEE